ncbi:MAG: hypothetical protein EO766_17255 [Hydrotalea sp. AMD]|uniref:hypothetical protein n=1 Tax=Hydrotalea sp. AMD TaxID=2501297 RepID=UPI0010259811|nr:hypothetical protein [Hydrotalea sp. AMD]RWZ84367.1 MAG: hypothetical protein EO766_17255 [Hydrotalea sp. AMD]
MSVHISDKEYDQLIDIESEYLIQQASIKKLESEIDRLKKLLNNAFGLLSSNKSDEDWNDKFMDWQINVGLINPIVLEEGEYYWMYKQGDSARVVYAGIIMNKPCINLLDSNNSIVFLKDIKPEYNFIKINKPDITN